MDETARDDRSLGQLFADLSGQMASLVRQEVALLRTEMTSKAGATGRDAAMIGLGGTLLYAAILGLMAAAALLLIEVGLAPWLSALLVAVVVAAIGAILVQQGRSGLTSRDLAPKRTMETLRTDAEWAKERLG